MPHYQSPDNAVHFLDSAEYEYLLPAGSVPITDEEAEELRPAPPPAPPKQFTSLEFLDLFTESEQLVIVQAGMANASVKLWYDRALAAQFITLSDPRTEAGLEALVSGGLLTAERKAEIVEAML
jgi:hypothetical protein